MDLNEAHKLWYNFEPISGVLFGYNDYVLIKSGAYAGECAKNVISLESLEPVTYLVELDLADGSGGNIVIAESEIESAEQGITGKAERWRN